MSGDERELELARRLLESERVLADAWRAAGAPGGRRPETPAELAALLAELEANASASRARVEQIESSLRFRLGSLLLELPRSPRAWGGLARLLAEGVRGAARGVRSRLRPTPPAVAPARAQVQALPEAIELFPVPAPPPTPRSLAGLRVAVIMDPFSLECFGPECELLPLHPDRWQSQLRESPPHLLLVESAWTGAGGEWRGGVEGAPAILRSIVGSCRAAGVPTVFWNKEDPLHFDAFLPAAKLFDHVFTTDARSIPRYKRALGHERVGLLCFAVQPRLYHPVADAPRAASSVFAGAWYGNLSERCADFERVADALALAGPLVIHDRNSGSAQPHQRFPARYAGGLRPAVRYEETAALFRAHRIGVNLNTIKFSPTMFARRALELMACNASVYGNYSLALHTLFGGLTISSDDPAALLEAAWRELREPDAPEHRERRLAALRKVLGEHLWSHRLATVARHALGVSLPAGPDGRLWVLGRAGDESALARLVAAFKAQVGVEATLVLDLAPGLVPPPGALVLEDAQPAAGDWLAVFHPDDHYGPHYLADLSLARHFQLGEVLGKGAWQAMSADGNVELRQPGDEYRRVDRLAMRRCLWRRARWPGSLAGALDAAAEGGFEGAGLVSLDALGYVAGGAGSQAAARRGRRLDEGVGLEQMNAFVARLPPGPATGGEDVLAGAGLQALFESGRMPPRTSVAVRNGTLEVCSLLEAGERASAVSAPLPRERVERDGQVSATLHATPSSQLDVGLEAVDARGNVLARLALRRGAPATMSPPADTAAYRLTLGFSGRFVRGIDGIWFGPVAAEPLVLPGDRRVLLVCNGYPEQGRLYRNAFVHRRVLAYRAAGVGVDVAWASTTEQPRSYEFEGVPVQVCDPANIAALLRLSRHAAVAVHSPDPVLWRSVAGAANERRVVAWVHGADIQPWTRRLFNHVTPAERAEAEAASERRMAFWRELLAAPPSGLHMVFVSRSFAEDAWSDLGLRLPDERWSVVPNPIDTGLFRHVAKPAGQRLRILSIRPHMSRIYANDLVAAAIRELASHPLFPQMAFTLVGDGPLWDENFSGLAAYPNVRLERRFLTQAAIARLHREHGVFLVPTRGDTHGVSRDEAMASGLVPVTNPVGAVPEFVDEACGILCPPDDPAALAAALAGLAGDPERFLALSSAAAARVRRTCDAETTTRREIDLLLGTTRGEPGC